MLNVTKIYHIQEVSCFGKEGEASDTGDHFKVVCSGDGWHQDDKIAFQHIDTGNLTYFWNIILKFRKIPGS
jgi:hypothetical protein